MLIEVLHREPPKSQEPMPLQTGNARTVIKTNDRIEKTCPFCSEMILASALKCKHCGEFLNKKRNLPRPLLVKAAIVVLALLSLYFLAFIFVACYEVIQSLANPGDQLVAALAAQSVKFAAYQLIFAVPCVFALFGLVRRKRFGKWFSIVLFLLFALRTWGRHPPLESIIRSVFFCAMGIALIRSEKVKSYFGGQKKAFKQTDQT